MSSSSTAVDKLEALGAPDEAKEPEPDHRPEENSPLRTKEPRESFALSHNTLARLRLRIENSGTKSVRRKSQLGLETDNNENIYTRRIDKDNAEAKKREAVAAQIIAIQEEPVSDSTPSEPETQTSEEWGSQASQATSWDLHSLPHDQETSSVASGNSRMQLVEDQPVSLRKVVRTVPFVEETATWSSETSEWRALSPKKSGKKSRFWVTREEDVPTARRKRLDTETAPIQEEGINAAEKKKPFLAPKAHGSKLRGVVHVPPIPETLVQAEAEWKAFEQMIKDPDILKRLSSHPSTKRLLDDVDLMQHISVLRDGLVGMIREHSFDLLLYNCLSKYGLCETLSLFGRFEKQSVVKGISELFHELKSLEDGFVAAEVAKTEIESIADRNDSMAISGPTESARVEFPFSAQTSSEDFDLQSEKHGSKSIFQNTSSLSGLPAITQSEVSARISAKNVVAPTGMELQIEEQIVPSASPTSTEVVPTKFGSLSVIDHGMIGDANVKKDNSNEKLISLVLTGTLAAKNEEYGTWWEGCMSTIRSQFRLGGSIEHHGIKRLLEVFPSTISNKIMQRRSLGESFKRLEWTCKCGHRSHDYFQELSPGAITELANDMFKAGYITHAQISGQSKSPASSLIVNVQNIFNAARRRILSLRHSTLPVFNTKPSPVSSIALPCLPSQRCRWLHMCLKKPPYATKLEPLHVCKDEEEKDFTDATFFRALRRAYFGSKSLRERLLFKLKKIEFVEFELCPENLVDHILPDKFPPTLDEYDFLPPPPLKKCPPIGTSHMMHLFTSCSAQPLNTNLYLRHIPKRKEQALSFRPDLVDAVTGWGLHFVESLNSALAVTVMFAVSLVLGIVFAICWCIWRQDVQGAFGVASYVTSVITLAAMTWQMWAF